jgi:hypothetical protein
MAWHYRATVYVFLEKKKQPMAIFPSILLDTKEGAVVWAQDRISRSEDELAERHFPHFVSYKYRIKRVSFPRDPNY